MGRYVKWLIKQTDHNSPRHEGKISLEDDDNAAVWVKRGYCKYVTPKIQTKAAPPPPEPEPEPEPKAKAAEVEEEARAVERPFKHRSMTRDSANRR